MRETDKKGKRKEMTEYYSQRKINLSENAIKVLERRYFKKDERGDILERPVDMFVRVARNIASAEKKYGKTEEEILEIEKEFFDIVLWLIMLVLFHQVIIITLII